MARLQLRIRIEYLYGCLAFFQTILHNVFLLYHVDLFVSVYKIDKTSFWIGETIFLIWNSFNDPIFGWISDRNYLYTSSKKNTDRVASALDIVNNRLKALMYNGPLFALSFILFWFPWGFPGLQFVVCLCLYDGFLTMIDLHYSALLADLAVSCEERARLNSKSSMFSALGSAGVFLSYAVWSKENLSSFRLFCSILCLVSLAGYIIFAGLMKKSYARKQQTFQYSESTLQCENSSMYEVDEYGEKSRIVSFVSQIGKHQNFIWFAIMNLVQVFHCHFNSNFFPLFLENLLGDSVGSGFSSALIGISFLAPHINNLFFLELCQKYGVYRVIKMLFSIKLFISLFMFVMGPNQVVLLCLFIASNRVFTEGTCKLLTLVITDLVDEDYVLHNRKKAVSALIFGSAALLSKPGQTLAPLIGTWFLTLQTGHDIFQSGNDLGSIKLDTSGMSSEAVSMHRQGCFNLLVYVPIVCALIQLAVWSQFTLHGNRLHWIKSRRAGQQHSFI